MRVTGMDTDRVEVFHRADRNDVALGIANYLKLDFLPAGNTFFNQNLSDRGKTQAVLRDVAQFFFMCAIPPPVPPRVKAGRTITG